MTENQTPTAPADKSTAVDMALERVALLTQGDFKFPENYAPENALRVAWLDLLAATTKVGGVEKPVLEVVTKNSVAKALTKMVTAGLSYAKGQCYFIPYGKTLEMEPSYLGTLAIAKRVAAVKDVNGNVVYQDDIFEYELNPETGRRRVLKHEQKVDNIANDKIKAAYVVVTFEDGSTKTEIMTITQIRTAWAQGAARGNSPAHQKFPDQMAIKTVINRALKLEIGSSDDADLMRDPVSESVKERIENNANREAISFEEVEPVIHDKAPELESSIQPEAPSVADVINHEPEKQKRKPNF